MKLVKLTLFQVSDLVACLEESYNHTTGENDLGIQDFHETLIALREALKTQEPN
jgi:hypothetical protein